MLELNCRKVLDNRPISAPLNPETLETRWANVTQRVVMWRRVLEFAVFMSLTYPWWFPWVYEVSFQATCFYASLTRLLSIPNDSMHGVNPHDDLLAVMYVDSHILDTVSAMFEMYIHTNPKPLSVCRP